MLQVLVDADNVAPRRLQPVLDLLSALLVGPAVDHEDDVQAAATRGVRVIASGRPTALRRLRWPPGTQLLAQSGWQRADLALAAAYSPTADPMLLMSGDGDFGLLATRHPGPVLVVSGAASGRLRDGTTVIDPATEGVEPIARWLAAHADLLR